MTEYTPTAVGTYPGIQIEYHEKPRRFYTVNSEEVPSVTRVLPHNPDPLMYYAERCTAEGAIVLGRISGYRFPRDMHVPTGARAFRLPPSVRADPRNGTWVFKWSDAEAIKKSDPKSLIWIKKDTDTLTADRIMVGHLKLLGLDHQSQTKSAADRGVDVHAVWEAWNERKEIPNASAYPEDRRGYIAGLAKFIMEYQPRCLESEMVVGSVTHGFAGRLDTVVVIDSDEGPSMVDVKTSKSIYPESHFPQLIGYEIARRECGLVPTARQGILRVGSDGDFELGWSDAVPEDFLCLLAAYKSQAKWTRKGKR